MGNDVLSESDLAFIKANAQQIKEFSSNRFGGHIPIEKREMYDMITLKLGRRYNINWTCAPCLKRIGQQLEQYIWH